MKKKYSADQIANSLGMLFCYYAAHNIEPRPAEFGRAMAQHLGMPPAEIGSFIEEILAVGTSPVMAAECAKQVRPWK